MSATPLARPLIIVSVCALAVLAAACGGGQQKVGRQYVHLVVKTFDGERSSYDLRCEPRSGTLPLADLVCSTIAQHPHAMLNPGPQQSVCSGSPDMPQLSVWTRTGAHASRFGGYPGCGWPGGAALAIYWGAIQREPTMIAAWRPVLRCDEDPVLRARPTPYASLNACTHRLWTPRTELLIRRAEHLPAIAALHPRRLFPSEIGARRCALGRRLRGLCGVYVRNVWSRPRAAFVVDWRDARNRAQRHTWRVFFSGTQPVRLAQSGAPPPWSAGRRG
jgi:hypothetical protein